MTVVALVGNVTGVGTWWVRVGGMALGYPLMRL